MGFQRIESIEVFDLKELKSQGPTVVACGLAAIAGIVLVYYGNKFQMQETLNSPPVEEPTASRILADGRIIIGASPRYLTHLYETNNRAVADKVAALYIGNWMEISGPFGDLSHPSRDDQSDDAAAKRVSASLAYRNGWPPMTMWFDAKRWQDHLEHLAKNQEILVRGRIESINYKYLVYVILEKCELLDLQTRRVIDDTAQ